MSSEDEVRAVLARQLEAVRNKDAEAIAANFHPDVVAFEMAPPLRGRGVRKVKETADAWLSSWEGPLEYEVAEAKVFASGDVAFTHGLEHVKGTKKGGQKVDMWFRTTMGLVRENGRWRIVHQHVSEPFDMTTFQAKLDLAP